MGDVSRDAQLAVELVQRLKAHQAASEFDSDETVAARMSLIDHPDVASAILALWTSSNTRPAPPGEEELLDLDEYLAMHKKFTLAVDPTTEPPVEDRQAAADWMRDSARGTGLSFDKFRIAVFVLTDLYTNSVTHEDYVDVLTYLRETCTKPQRGGGSAWRKDRDVIREHFARREKLGHRLKRGEMTQPQVLALWSMYLDDNSRNSSRRSSIADYIDWDADLDAAAAAHAAALAAGKGLHGEADPKAKRVFGFGSASTPRFDRDHDAALRKKQSGEARRFSESLASSRRSSVASSRRGSVAGSRLVRAAHSSRTSRAAARWRRRATARARRRGRVAPRLREPVPFADVSDAAIAAAAAEAAAERGAHAPPTGSVSLAAAG